MKEAIKFLYLGSLPVSVATVKDLLEAAEYLQIVELKKCCSDYLYSIELTVDNCVHLSLLSSLYDLDLYNKTFQYLRGHLPDVMDKDEMLQLTKESITVLLTDETLTYVPQIAFFKFIVRWTNHDLENRKEYFADLFTLLDLSKIGKTNLEEDIESNELVVNDEKCKIHVLNVKLKHMSGLLSETSDHKDVILLCGGSGPGVYIGHFMLPFSDFMAVSNVFAYIIDEKRWTELSPLPYAIRRPMLICDNTGNFYVYDTSHSLEGSYIFQFKVTERTWSSIKVSFPSNCENVSVQNMLCCANRIFFVASGMTKKSRPGGSTAGASSSSPQPTWNCFLMEVNLDGAESQICCNLFPRNVSTELKACVFNNVYVCVSGWKCGEKQGKGSRGNSRFVYYDVKQGRRIDGSKSSHFETCMLPFQDGILVGKPGKTNVRVFSFKDRRWRSRRDLSIPLPPENPDRTDYSYVCHNEELYVFGGKSQDTRQPLKNVFKYNLEKKVWHKLEDMPESLMGSGVSVGRLPTAQVCCHINCPHCQYITRRSQATYDITYSDPDEDDDYSYDDYSYEYSNHSYLWDDDDGDIDDEDMMDQGYDYWGYWRHDGSGLRLLGILKTWWIRATITGDTEDMMDQGYDYWGYWRHDGSGLRLLGILTQTDRWMNLMTAFYP